MEREFSAKRVLLTPSCTHSLELAALSIDIKNGDEVIMPSYTFVSTANAFVLRGAVPVFVDIREDTLNIDEQQIEEKISDRTRAIVPVHYAGVACEMDKILEIAKHNNIFVIEDAAQAVNAKYKGKHLGTIGDLGCYSFHDTKNYTCGEGGAILINDPALIEIVEILREKGTNRSRFLRGEVDKYTWVGVGSSYLLSDIQAAVLYAQLEQIDDIQKARHKIYKKYIEGFSDLEREGLVTLPHIPSDCESNYHLFYILTKDENEREDLFSHLRINGIYSTFHYIPLHTSEMGKRFGYKEGSLPVTESISSRIARIPIYPSLTEEEQERIVKSVNCFYKSRKSKSFV